jgi:ubiquinone/menaquinone biosynthesis C-methylase UbiE
MSQAYGSETLREWRETAQYWSKHSDIIRTMFAPLTRALIEQAGIGKGQDVIDVAAGAGEPSLTIAEKVGPTGSVTCTDAVAEMVDAARTEAAKRGLSNVQFRQCTADSLPFADESFDAAVSRLGIMFFPDPVAGCREMLRVTKGGGALAFAVWHKSELNPFCSVPTEVMSRYVEPTPFDADAPGAFRFAEPGKLSRVMAMAGATDIKERVIKFDIAAPISAAQFWEMRSQTSDALRQKLAKQSDAQRTRIAEELSAAVAEFFPRNEMKFPARMIIVSGHKGK